MEANFVPATPNPANCNDDEGVRRSRRLAAQLAADKITFQEYAYNTMLAMINAPDEQMENCLSTVPTHIARQFADFLRAYLGPIDFMPCPLPFAVASLDSREMEAMKRQLRPKYIRLNALIGAKAE